VELYVMPERARVQHVVRFPPCRVYTESTHRGTLGFEWTLAHYCHLIFFLMS
jgi:hypothetical protein